MLRSYSNYKGCRIFVPESGDFDIDPSGRYRVHAALGKYNSSKIVRVPIADCLATDYNEAIGLSIEHAMRLVDAGWAYSIGAVQPDS